MQPSCCNISKRAPTKNGEDTECGRYEKDQDNSGHVVLSTSMKQTPVSSAVLACFKCGAMCFSKFSRTAKCQVLPGSVLGQYRRAKEAFTFDGPGSTSVFFAAFLVAFLLGASASPVPSTLPSASSFRFLSAFAFAFALGVPFWAFFLACAFALGLLFLSLALALALALAVLFALAFPLAFGFGKAPSWSSRVMST